ncbi:hypothetical protein BLA24_06540 [Streptomyces cinnamoneus]|uniref:Lantibiotic dehydratase N-terminal domain-containing protein n=1 Tax=Streptomyces cinnamoneus TaxID=53446 RepID=A0A2G1XMH7_STRCJ|nr:lantibiotic dehydratase [Streptomyces cinnamoneus]PHQ52438.1 hypothetical protein BLA24_06540 [Streptomyces cinnamoneus]PPT15970.1 hypothetical protein CYQ11_26690 [Streptomyces cinnamoneus]
MTGNPKDVRTPATGVADVVQLRLNPLSGRRLSVPAMRARLDELITTWQAREALAQPACDALYELVAAAEGKERGRLLALKRAVFNGKDPRPADLLEPLPEEVTRWAGAQRAHRAAADAVEALSGRTAEEERTILLETLRDDDFRASLALVAPGVYSAVQRYLAGDGLEQRDRKSERGIFQYLSRAMLRTSPLSRFTATGLFAWGEDGLPMDGADEGARRGDSRVSVDRALFSYVCGGLVEPAEAGTLVKRHPTVVAENNRLVYSRPEGDKVRMLSTPLTRPLHALLSLTLTGAREATELGAEIAARLGVPEDKGMAVVRGALRVGILIPLPPVDDQAVDIVAEATEVLGDRHPRAAAEFAALDRALKTVATGSVDDRVAALEDVQSVESRLIQLSGRPARLQVHEDLALLPGRVDASRHRKALGDLAAMLELRSVFDRQHDVRAMLVACAVDLLGSGFDVRLVDVAEDLVTMFYRRENALDDSTLADLGPADGSLAALYKVREDVLTELVKDVCRHTGAEETNLDPARFAGLSAQLPERFRRIPSAYGVLVQPAGDRLVVNDIYPGHGMTYTRFLAQDQADGGRATASLRDRLTGLYGPAVREDHGLHDANINHHVRVLDETVTPQQWAGIRLVHDPEADELFLADAGGQRVVIVPLGMKWPELLPEPLRIASWLFDTGRLVTDVVHLAHQRTGLGLSTTAYPRVTFGDVVMHRRRWYYGTDLPLAGESRAEHLVRLTEWRARHGVPEQVMAKTPATDTDLSDLDERAGQISYMRKRLQDKPQYLDLASLTAARVMPRLLERRNETYFEEALPAVRDGRNAFEWVVEFDRAPFGTFSADRKDRP